MHYFRQNVIKNISKISTFILSGGFIWWIKTIVVELGIFRLLCMEYAMMAFCFYFIVRMTDLFCACFTHTVWISNYFLGFLISWFYVTKSSFFHKSSKSNVIELVCLRIFSIIIATLTSKGLSTNDGNFIAAVQL